jgi:hypothetical protein
MWITIIVIAVLLLWGFLAVRSMIKNKKNGGSVTCGGSCAGCSGACHSNIKS